MTEDVAGWELAGMGVTAVASGSQGRLFPEQVLGEHELRGKGLPGEYRAGARYITHQKTIAWNWLILLWL